MVEFYYNIQSNNGTITDDHNLRRWSELYSRAHEGSRDLRAPMRFKSLFDQAGFVEVETRMIPVHLNGWSGGKHSHKPFVPHGLRVPHLQLMNANVMLYIDARQSEIGHSYKDVFKGTLSALGLHPLVETIGLSLSEAQILIASARHELDNLSLNPYLGLYAHPLLAPPGKLHSIHRVSNLSDCDIDMSALVASLCTSNSAGQHHL